MLSGTVWLWISECRHGSQRIFFYKLRQCGNSLTKTFLFNRPSFSFLCSFVYIYYASESGCEVLWWLRLCVCLSARISPEPHARSLPIFVHVAYRYGSVLFRQGDEIPRGRGILGVFLPIYNALYSIAFGTHTKWPNRSRCRLGWWVGLARGTVCYVRVTISKGKGQFWGKHVPDKPNTLIIASWTGRCRGTLQRQTLHCKRWTSLLSAAKWG